MEQPTIAEDVLTIDRPSAMAAAEMLPDGLVTANSDGRITFLNHRARQILGSWADGLVGRHLRDGIPLETRNGDSWWDVTDPWRGVQIRTGHREKLLQLPDGRELLVTARYLRKDQAGPLGAIFLGLRDAEARRRAEQDHAALISTIAHELRSPLTGVKGFSSTLLRRWAQLGEEQRLTMLRAIDGDADRLTRLITDLLDVSRIDAGKLRIHEVPLPIRETFTRHVDRLAANGHDASDFTVTVEPGAEEVYADADRLDQVLANLIENALRHGEGHVELSATPHDDDGTPGIVIGVRDDGPGIPEEKRRVVFGRFWHGQSGSGTGLGLYIVRGIVEAHGGWADIGDSPGGGAMVRVFLPSEPV